MGLMLTPNMGNAPDLQNTLWAADTGCYSRGDSFDLGAYLCWLHERREYVATCLFATAPDVVGDAKATIRRSARVLPVLRTFGFQAAFVGQDGIENCDVPWDSFDAYFVGGSTAWKLSEASYGVAREAKRRGKWLHMGRVNSEDRFSAAATAGFGSVDGTYIAFGPDVNLPRVERWLRNAEQQTRMTL